MQALLHQLTTKPTHEHIVWYLLLICTVIATLIFISKLEDEDSDRIISIITSFIICITLGITFSYFHDHINQNIENAIKNKEYTLNLNGAVLNLTSNSPYLKSEILEVVYQDDKRFQIKYNNQYFDIDKSQEKIEVK